MTTAVIRFRKSAADQVNHRIEQENAGKGAHDIFNLLLQFEDKSTGEKMGFKELSDEAVVLIIADKSIQHTKASDTTDTALTGLSFYLARYPECYNKLKREIRSTFFSVENIINGDRLVGCKYLPAWVEEALRMAASVPGYLEWKSARDSVIDGHAIPTRAKDLAYNTIYLTMARLAFPFEIEAREPLPLEFHVKDHFAARGKIARSSSLCRPSEAGREGN